MTKDSDALRAHASTARDISQEVRTPTDAEELLQMANHMESEADRLEGEVETPHATDMTSMPGGANKAKRKDPAATMSGGPDQDLELALERDPSSKQAQVDVGSDGSMDASDPPAACQPGGSDPASSNDFPDTELK